MEVAEPTHFHLAKRLLLPTLCVLMLSNGALAQSAQPSVCDQFEDIRRPAPPGERGTRVTWTAPDDTVTDQEYSVYRSSNPGDMFMVGEPTTVSYAFIYPDGRTVICSFTVTVEEGAPTTCPDGSQPMQCAPNPCTSAVCRGNPNAQCRVNYCTGCTAEFFDTTGTPVQCIEGPQVDRTPPVCQCGDDFTRTIPVGDGGADIRFTECTATDNSGTVRLEDQSHSNGQRFLVGTTEVTYEFSDPSNNRVSCSFRITVIEATCPDGSDPIACLTNPCDTATCSAYPNAACRPNYCGGCNAEFYDDRRNQVDCDQTATCPDGSDPIACLTNPCDTATCSAYPNAACRPNYCGGCNAEFYDERRNQVDCDQTVDRIPPVCECGDDVTSLIPLGVGGANIRFTECTATDNSGTVRLEDSSHTPGQRFLVGTTEVTYEFSDPSNNRVSCSFRITVIEATCPDGSDPIACLTNPCDTAICSAYPNAACRPNYCGGCNAEFYDERRNRMDCDRPAPGGCEYNGRTYALRDSRRTEDGCNTCYCMADGSWSCTEIACESCPDGSQPFECAENPCDVYRCEAVPNAECRPDRCGGCFAKFFDRNTRTEVNCSETGFFTYL
ncbi:hyalin-like [Amphiura filiformis]|uniref:hyalin-like n=1 Tax=Amphiura filiformis TaxID=82378 RepID=UPI003B2167B3